MIPGTSIVPTRSWQARQASQTSVPSVTLFFGVLEPNPTVFSDVKLLPVATPVPSVCTTPNILIVELSTTVVIPDFRRFFHTPIESFQPTYHALDDGSLVSRPLISDIRTANVWLLVFGALGWFFLANTFTALRYIRKGQVKNKSLLYVLLGSQIFGLVAIIPVVVSYFDQFANCNAIGLVARTSIMLSYSLLMTGVLGIKAYRCLNSSRIVLVILACLRTGMIATLVIELISLNATRRLSGSCDISDESKALSILIVLQFLESFFICVCFLFAVWQTAHNPVDRGRLSIQVSMDGREGLATVSESKEALTGPTHQTRRGWWDYVPEEPQSQVQRGSTGPAALQSSSNVRGLLSKIRDKVQYLLRPTEVPPSAMRHRPSLLGERPIANPPRTSSLNFADMDNLSEKTVRRRVSDVARNRQSAVPRPPSVISRISKYMPRMMLFRQVVKDELLYTTMITALFLVTAILMLVGVNCKLLLGADGWVTFNWVVVSLFTMQSFSRVVRRHEREAILQHPSAWDPMYRAELEATRAFRQGRTGRPHSPISIASHRLRRTPTSSEDPFRDSQNSTSLYSPARSSRPRSNSTGTSHLSSRPWHTARELSISTKWSYETSPAPSINLERLVLSDTWDNPAVLPSPFFGEYASTPSCNYSCDTPSDTRHILRPRTAPADVLNYGHIHSTAHSSFDSRTRWEPPDSDNRMHDPS